MDQGPLFVLLIQQLDITQIGTLNPLYTTTSLVVFSISFAPKVYLEAESFCDKQQMFFFDNTIFEEKDAERFTGEELVDVCSLTPFSSERDQMQF